MVFLDMFFVSNSDNVLGFMLYCLLPNAMHQCFLLFHRSSQYCGGLIFFLISHFYSHPFPNLISVLYWFSLCFFLIHQRFSHYSPILSFISKQCGFIDFILLFHLPSLCYAGLVCHTIYLSYLCYAAIFSALPSLLSNSMLCWFSLLFSVHTV